MIDLLLLLVDAILMNHLEQLSVIAIVDVRADKNRTGPLEGLVGSTCPGKTRIARRSRLA
jgi:hypothetical protein